MRPHRIHHVLAAIALLVLPFTMTEVWAQRGKIIRPSNTTVLDPDGNGFVSATTAGFSNDGYYVDEFELRMFGIPKLGGDVPGDNIGKLCGITDLIPDRDGYSVYAVRDANDNLIFRFRVGDDNPSVEAWTILLDTDGSIGASDPNATSFNPGFEIDITLIKRNNSGVLVYNIDGTENCPSPLLFYDIDSNFQISIADEVSCGDPDYFYDFFVPLADIAAAFGIDINTGLRYVAVTNVSATCAMDGQIGDIGGVDNNDPAYSGCESCAFEDLVNNQCPTALVDLCETCAGFEKDKVSKPVIDVPIRAGQTVITGSTVESDIFIRLQVYTNTAPEGSPPAWGTVPREEKSVYTVGTLWSVTLTDPLLAFDKIVAIAQKDEFSVPCGANDDNSSSTSVTVVSPNTPPVAQDQSMDVVEDTSTGIVLTGTDPENDVLLYTILTSPANGTLSGSPPNVTYTPDPDYSGADAFTFTVNDGIFDALNPGTVSINVTPMNDAPHANSLVVSTPEDTPVATTLSASDVDGDPLTFTVTTQPAHGTLSGSAPNLTYTPDPNYFGGDSFSYFVNDGQEDSNTANVSITISPVGDDPPAAEDQNVMTPEDTPVAVTLTGSDPDLDALTFAIVSPPANGTLTGTPPNVTYSPALNYTGPDSFSFKANDGSQDSPDATVTLSVTPVNDPPVAFDQAVPYDMDTPKGITLTGSDPDGDGLTFAVTLQPSSGTLSGTPPNVTYTPNAGFTGNDSFRFTVNDGTVTSAEATVSLNVNPLSNQAPVATDQSVTTAEDVSVQIVLAATDANGDALTYTITQLPANGTVNATGANVVYTPDQDFFGSDSFRFEASDGSLTSNEATVTITVNPLNDPPVANGNTIVIVKNTPTDILLTGADVEGSTLTFTVTTLPAHGTISASGATVTYTPETDYTGGDSFTFVASDGDLSSAPATISILVTSPGSPPAAVDNSVTTNEDTPVDVDLSTLVSDADGDALTYTVQAQPKHGTVGMNGAILTYTPDTDYFGRDTLTFSGNDGNSESNTAAVFIRVLQVNDAPVAIDQNIATDEDVAVDIVLSATDTDGGTFNYAIVSSPVHGKLTGTAPALTYTPSENYNGSDVFTFRVNDGFANSNVATVSITVNPVNDAPVISPIVGLPLAKEDSLFQICIAVTDVDADVVAFNDPVNVKGGGTMVRNAAPFDFCYTFTPASNYNGQAIWDFLVVDDKGLSGTRAGDILILPVNDPPVALDDQGQIPASGTLLVNVVANDLPIADPYQEFYDLYAADSTDAVMVARIVNGPVHGIAEVQPDKFTIQYKASSFTFVGADSVRYEICDSGHPALCTTAVLYIDVTDSEFPFKVYEGVSPNNDGQNDYLHIDGIHRHPDNLVRIFDRYNNLVWEGTGYDNEGRRWDGAANNGLGRVRLPDGTYYYTVYLNDTGETYSGYVILKEN